MALERIDGVDNNTLQILFIKILRCELCEMELDDAIKAQLTPAVIESIYLLAKSLDVVHIAASALFKSELLNDADLLADIKREESLAVYRHEQINYAYEQICNTFEELNIPYIPLKGSVLRPYYPRESMRTSCDIDILIKEDDLDRAIGSLVSKGYQFGERNYHAVSIYSPAKVLLELHFSLQQDMDVPDQVLKDAWSYAVAMQGCRYALSNEFLVFHQFAHMFYHFVFGGCGIRSLMDIWVMKSRMGLSYPDAKPLLEKAEIYQFAYEMSYLADSCFGDAAPNDIFDTLIDYIISSGTYGSRDNTISAAKLQGGGLLTYILKRCFPPYRSMACLYPVLRRFPILLPFCYVLRLGKLFQKESAERSINDLKIFRTVSDSSVHRIEQIWKRLGIK